MYTITLNREKHPNDIYFHGKRLTQRGKLSIQYLTREITEAFDQGLIYINPVPTVITPNVLQVTNSTGGVISQEIAPITNFSTANDAISTLLEQQKRITIDSLVMVEEVTRIEQQLLDIESRLSKS